MRNITIIFVFCLSSFLARATVIIHVTDGYGFMKAISEGNVVLVNKLINSTTDPEEKNLYIAVLQRIRGNIAESTLHAKKCYSPQKILMEAPVSMYCGLILAGNALSEGEISAWANMMEFIKEKKSPYYQEMAERVTQHKAGVGNNDHIHYDIDIFSRIKDYKQFIDWPYTMRSVFPNAKNEIIPVKWHRSVTFGHVSFYPFITLKINGKSIQGMLDTGTEGNIVLNKKNAKMLGISDITPGWAKIRYIGNNEYSSSLGNAHTVSIGGIKITNIPITITAEDNSPVIIGINFLHQLRTFSVSYKKFIVYSNSHLPSCVTSLSERSDISGDTGFLNIPITINGNNTDAILDTGSPMLFYEARSNLPPEPYTKESSSTKNNHSQYGSIFQNTRSDFSIYGEKYIRETHPIFRLDGPFNYGVGSWLLMKSTIFIDFKKSHMCVWSSHKNEMNLQAIFSKTGWTG